MNRIKAQLKRFWGWIVVVVVGGVALVNMAGIPPEQLSKFQIAENCIASPKQIHECIGELDSKEKSKIKSAEIAKFNHIGKFIKGDLEIEVHSLKAIDGGVELFARAWKNGQQFGFGKDGSVEIERFRIFNPPILVPDGTKQIIQQKLLNELVDVEIDNYKEDPIEAIRQSLAHIISLVGKENTGVVVGKIGNTTSTFYPDPNTESTSVDGYASKDDAESAWATLRGQNGVFSADSNATEYVGGYGGGGGAGNFYALRRTFFLFDTSSIPDTDTVDSATFSLYADSKNDNMADSLALVEGNPASNTAIANSDYEGNKNFNTKYATSLDITAITLSAYNDFTLNATGISAIIKTGITKFQVKSEFDLADSPTPTWAGGDVGSGVIVKAADTAGTTTDPKLVVVHSAVSGKPRRQIIKAPLQFKFELPVTV